MQQAAIAKCTIKCSLACRVLLYSAKSCRRFKVIQYHVSLRLNIFRTGRADFAHEWRWAGGMVQQLSSPGGSQIVVTFGKLAGCWLLFETRTSRLRVAAHACEAMQLCRCVIDVTFARLLTRARSRAFLYIDNFPKNLLGRCCSPSNTLECPQQQVVAVRRARHHEHQHHHCRPVVEQVDPGKLISSPVLLLLGRIGP